jgi:hypothetical protein
VKFFKSIQCIFYYPYDIIIIIIIILLLLLLLILLFFLNGEKGVYFCS